MPNYAIQEQNQDMVSLLSAYFRLLYNPIHAMSDASALYRSLPGLVAFYPGAIGLPPSSIGSLRDMSGAGMNMSRTSVPYEDAESSSLRRWVHLDGVDDYWFTTNNAYNSILGNENSIGSVNGLTVMAWVRPTRAASATEAIFNKWLTTGNQRSWFFLRNSTKNLQFIISNDGTATFSVSSTNTLDDDEWRFVAGRFTPSTEIKIWEGYTNGLTTDENTTSIPATLFDSTGNLSVGASNTSGTATNFYEGDLSLIALCKAALPDAFINAIFNMTIPLFLDSVQ